MFHQRTFSKRIAAMQIQHGCFLSVKKRQSAPGVSDLVQAACANQSFSRDTEEPAQL